MEGAFGWISELLGWFASWVPRPQLVQINEKGIKFCAFRAPVKIEPKKRNKWVWHIPIFTEIQTVNVARQTLNIDAETLMTNDGKTVIAAAVAVYRITDIYKYLVENHDAEEALAEVASAAVRKAIIGKDLAKIQGGRADIDNALKRECEKLMEQFGVEIEYVRLTSFGPARVINIVGVQPFVQPSTDEE